MNFAPIGVAASGAERRISAGLAAAHGARAHDEAAHNDDAAASRYMIEVTVLARLSQSEPSLTDSTAHHSRALAIERATEESGLSRRPKEGDTRFIVEIHVRALSPGRRDSAAGASHCDGVGERRHLGKAARIAHELIESAALAHPLPTDAGRWRSPPLEPQRPQVLIMLPDVTGSFC